MSKLNNQSFNLMKALEENEQIEIKKKIIVDSYHEELIESKELKESDESILRLVKKSIVNGKLPEEIEYKGKTYKQFNVMDSDNSGETSDIYYCNMENTPSGDPQESNDYFFVKVVLNKTENGYKGIKEVRFAEDLTESKNLTEERLGNNTFTDKDEAEYYRNKELYHQSGLERHKEAMDKAKEACKSKGIEVDETEGVYESCNKNLKEERVHRNPDSDPNAEDKFIKKEDKEDCNKEELKEDEDTSKEERLASLKTQLEVDGDQLADDEKEAIQNEINQLENELNEEGAIDANSEVVTEECDKPLKEEYSEKLGGDPEDFVSDCQSILEILNGIDTESFGTHLAQQMIEEWIETAESQIRMTKSRYNLEEDEDMDSEETEEETLEDAINRAHEEEVSAIETYDAVLSKTDESTDVKLIEMINEIKADEEDHKLLLQHYIETGEALSDDELEALKNSEESTEEAPAEEPIEESENIVAEEKVTNLKEVKSQGNIFMLQDDSKFFVGENYLESEGLLENAEIYENKEEADKDYLSRCEITKDGEPANIE